MNPNWPPRFQRTSLIFFLVFLVLLIMTQCNSRVDYDWSDIGAGDSFILPDGDASDSDTPFEPQDASATDTSADSAISDGGLVDINPLDLPADASGTDVYDPVKDRVILATHGTNEQDKVTVYYLSQQGDISFNQEFLTVKKNPIAVKFSPAGDLAAIMYDNNFEDNAAYQVTLLSIAANRTVSIAMTDESLDPDFLIGDLAFSADGSYLYFSNIDAEPSGGIYRFKVLGQTLALDSEWHVRLNSPERIAVYGNRLATISATVAGKTPISLINVEDQGVSTTQIEAITDSGGLEFSPDGSRLYLIYTMIDESYQPTESGIISMKVEDDQLTYGSKLKVTLPIGRMAISAGGKIAILTNWGNNKLYPVKLLPTMSLLPVISTSADTIFVDTISLVKTGALKGLGLVLGPFLNAHCYGSAQNCHQDEDDNCVNNTTLKKDLNCMQSDNGFFEFKINEAEEGIETATAFTPVKLSDVIGRWTEEGSDYNYPTPPNYIAIQP